MAIDYSILAIILVFSPLFMAALVGLNSRRISDSVAQFLTCLGVSISAVAAAIMFHYVIIGGNIVHIAIAPWLESGDFKANWAIYIDPLTAVMLIVVTWVSALVHIYSVGYMSHDAHKPRFMAYLSLFTFCMLMLVTADNFAQLFFGWEGVGLSSYLLIGFWYTKASANNAAIKAFLVNRVGDLGFALGIFSVYILCESIEFTRVFSYAREYLYGSEELEGMVTMTCLLLFIGCMGKSAQIGLHTWLPDAMEGPTPVSALIHAATMVTAGVFMLARCSPLFECSQTALDVVTIVGAVTCIFAASIALVQNDIKRIIAYSTCSQLGYMFFACGVSAYSAGIFHLMTHAFFKALLFLGAGSVIHAMSDEQDIHKMGGIWRLIPATYVMMWIGSLALAGIYPFAGFYSKDMILEAAYAHGQNTGTLAYWLGIIAATMTAFYSWRLLFLSFHGTPRASKEVMSHVHESPLVMTIPLLLLAIGSVISGWVGVRMGMITPHSGFWRDSIYVAGHNPIEMAHHLEAWVGLLPMMVGILGILFAYAAYISRPNLPALLKAHMRWLHTTLLNKWYFDELYDRLFVQNSRYLGSVLWKQTDARWIDGIPNGAAAVSYRFAKVVSFIQSGYLFHYNFSMLLGLLFLITWVVYRIY
ncbi:MAG: NADH-quinone oxidoreductase subunit L [Proteobacteria bacterium]|nr:NADH-quinone oxidoreductase subunit L [Pseudomonadota bacterium]